MIALSSNTVQDIKNSGLNARPRNLLAEDTALSIVMTVFKSVSYMNHECRPWINGGARVFSEPKMSNVATCKKNGRLGGKHA